MNPAQLVDYFDRISEAPDAIPRLRSLILDLAVRGKIVPQNPSDGQGSELLMRIQAEEGRRQKEANIRKGRRLPCLAPDEIPFDPPQGWKWLRLVT